MSLRSQFFQDDVTLQKCLMRDSAHVLPGARGPHVAKIQSALLLLDRRLALPASELRLQHYGPQTAAAVLDFKRKRKIINTVYQDTADNIVGKMTIARLDDELLALEQRPDPARAVCHNAAAGPVLAAQSSEALVGTPSASFLLLRGQTDGPPRPAPRPPVTTFRSARVSILFHETEAAAQAGGGAQLLLGQFLKARQLMAPFGLDFVGADNGIFGLIGPSIPDFEQVISGSPVSTHSVRAAAERVLPGQPGVVRVIYCPFSIKDDVTFGVTDGGVQVADWKFPKFCLINVRKANPDQGTLLHELIHAARPEKREHDIDPTSVFSEPGNSGRSKLPPEHAEALAHAFFSTILS